MKSVGYKTGEAARIALASIIVSWAVAKQNKKYIVDKCVNGYLFFFCKSLELLLGLYSNSFIVNVSYFILLSY